MSSPRPASSAWAPAGVGLGGDVEPDAQAGQRGAKLVADIGEQLALGPEERLDAVGELVEGGGDLADLVAAGELDAGGEVARGEAPGRAGEATQRAGEAAGEQQRGGGEQHEGDDGGEQDGRVVLLGGVRVDEHAVAVGAALDGEAGGEGAVGEAEVGRAGDVEAGAVGRGQRGGGGVAVCWRSVGRWHRRG
jgi:hypothetical protein